MSITKASAAQLRQKKREVNPTPSKYEIYTCPELGRTSTRPNAYDAYDLPSMYSGIRLPYRFSSKSKGR